MDVLIIEDEIALLESLREGLEAALPGHEFVGVPSVEEAEPLMSLHCPRLVISDIRLPGKNGVEFLLEIEKKWPGVKVILMSAFGLPTSSRPAGSLVKFLSKPFALEDMIALVEDVLDNEDFSGSVEGITLVDVLQVLNMGRRSGAITVRKGRQTGEICLQEGEVTHARLGDLVGTEAFRILISWRSGKFSLENRTRAEERTIGESFAGLLMEAFRLIDESNRGAAQRSTPGGVGLRIKQMLSEVVEKVPECVAAGLVNLELAVLLGVETVEDHPPGIIDLLSGAARDLFQGVRVDKIERLLKRARGVDKKEPRYFREIIVLSKNVIHVFLRFKTRDDQVLVVVTRLSANLGMVVAKTRSFLDRIEAQV